MSAVVYEPTTNEVLKYVRDGLIYLLRFLPKFP